MTYLTKQQVEEMFDEKFGHRIYAVDGVGDLLSFIHSLREKDLESLREWVGDADRARGGDDRGKTWIDLSELLSHLDTLKK